MGRAHVRYVEGGKKRACLLLLLLSIVVFREGDKLLLLVLLSLAGRHGVQGVPGWTIGVERRYGKGVEMDGSWRKMEERVVGRAGKLGGGGEVR